MYLERIELKNFRIFKNNEFSFRPLTLITGANSSGKSTLLNAIAAMLQTRLPMQFPFHLRLNGEFCKLGYFNDILSKGAKEDFFEIALSFKGMDISTKYIFDPISDLVFSEFYVDDGHYKAQICRNNSGKYYFEDEKNEDGTISTFIDEEPYIAFAYQKTIAVSIYEYIDTILSEMFVVSPFRGFPDRFLPPSAMTDALMPNGENMGSIILNWQKNSPKKFLELVEALRSIKIIDSIEPDKVAGGGISLNIRPYGHSIASNMADVGFGVSQVLPVVVADMALPEYGTLIAHQPEEHLHPSSQADLANYFSARLDKRRYIIETHSEYIINRLRLLVMQGKVAPEKVKIIYLDVPSSKRQVSDIYFNKNGSLEGAPESFFRTYYNDSFEMAMVGAE